MFSLHLSQNSRDYSKVVYTIQTEIRYNLKAVAKSNAWETYFESPTVWHINKSFFQSTADIVKNISFLQINN